MPGPTSLPVTMLLSRAAAVVGWLAHAIGRLFGAIAWFAPRGIPWALVIAALLIFGAWRSVEDARGVLATQPRPAPVPLADVADVRATGWVGTSTVVRGPFLDSSTYGAPVQRWYYLLLDPLDDTVAMVARSAERLEARRTRTIVARIETDPEAVAAARAALAPDGLTVDPDRYLVELGDRRPSVLVGDEIATPAGRGLDGEEVILRGSFDVGRAAADGDGWEYLVRSGGRAVVVRSPYAPDSLPVDVWGIAATDPLRTGQAVAVPELQSALGDRRVPDRRLLAEGVTPPVPQASFLPAMILAALAMLLATSWLIGYPVFRRVSIPSRIASWPLAAGDEVAADLFGSDRRGGPRVVVAGAPARLQLLEADELERRSWQFALREAVRLAPAGEPAATRSAGLTLSSGEGPILLRLDPGPPELRLAPGILVDAGRTRPALRIRATGLDLVAAFATAVERDRAITAIDPGRMGAVREGEPPGPPARRPPRASTGDRLPVPLLTAATTLAVVGGVLGGGGALGVLGALGASSDVIPGVVQIAAGTGLLAVGRGIWLRRDWAHGVGFTACWVGAAVSAFLVVAAPQCGLWLSPNLTACQAAGPVGVAAALAAAIGLGYAALAIRRHASAFVR